MNLEDRNQMCSNSSKSSKKQKQKKIPQRGMGVEKLEKFRIEEQQKEFVAKAILTYPTIVPPSNSSSLTVPFINYPSSQSPPSVISSPQNPILRPVIPSVENLHLNSVLAPYLIHPNGGGFDVKWPSVPVVDGSGHLHKMWYPYEVINHEPGNSRWDHGLPLRPNVSLPFESNPIMPPSYIMPRPPQFSQASASSLMNIPLMNSPVISTFQIEPPSNQSSYSNISSLWPEEGKMASIKRRSPFPLDMPALPSFQSKLPRIASTSDESTPFGNGSVFNGDYPVPIFRETPLTPSSSTSEPTTKKSKKGNGNQHGGFLTLASPSVTSPHPSPGLRHSLSHRIREEQVANSPRSAGLNHRYTENPPVNQGPRSFFSFFPASKVQQESSAANNNSNSGSSNSGRTGEVGGTIDLNLKL